MPVLPLLLLLSASPEAELRADQATEVEAVIVTGERVARSLQKTAASVDVATEAELRALAGADRVDQVLQLVPNVQVGDGGQAPSIRGQDATGELQGADAFLGGSRPRATVQVDGRALGFNEFIYGLQSVWDVDRVEVFRGPQTTTQGRNSIAGAIFVETNDPTFTPEARLRAVVGDYDTRQASLAVSGPLLGDQVAGRATVDVRRHRSWVKHSGGGGIPGEDRSADDYALFRGKLLVEPRAAPDLRLELTYAHLQSRNPQGEFIQAPFEARTNRDPDSGYWKTRVDSVVADADYRLRPGLDLSVTGAFGDAGIDRLASTPGGGVARVDAQDLSLETVLRWAPPGGAFDGLFGVYALRTEQDESLDLSDFIGLGRFRDEQTSLGVFGEGTLEARPGLFATLGARQQRDAQRRLGALSVFEVDYDESFDAFLPKLGLAYDIDGRTRIGVTAQKGFNPGGTTISFETGRQDRFDAETLWNYEAYLRARRLNGRLVLNANLFAADYSDAQRPQTFVIRRPDGSVAFDTEIANAPEARAYGLEADAAFQVSDRFTLRGALGLLDTEITETLDPADPVRGREFQRAPAYSATVAVSFQPVERLTVDIQARRYGDNFADDANTEVLEPATVADVQLGYEIRNVRLFAFARNVFDEFYLTERFGDDFGSAGDPRELGVGLEARF